jgi:hypothetical protein
MVLMEANVEVAEVLAGHCGGAAAGSVGFDVAAERDDDFLVVRHGVFLLG